MSKGVRDRALSVSWWIIRGKLYHPWRHSLSVMQYPSCTIRHALSIMHYPSCIQYYPWPLGTGPVSKRFGAPANCVKTGRQYLYRTSVTLSTQGGRVKQSPLILKHTLRTRWHEAREAPVVVWGCVPQQGPGAEPRWGLRGARPPENIGKLIQL